MPMPCSRHVVVRTIAVFAVLLGAMRAAAADTITFGAAISITGKTAKEGEYTRDG